MESTVRVQCREVDVSLVRECIPEAIRLFHEHAPKGFNVQVDLEPTYLPPPPGPGVVNFWSGYLSCHGS